MVQANLRQVDGHGRKYLTADERRLRFIAAAAQVKRPADRTFVLTIAHTGARVSEVLALRALDVDLDAGTVRIRTFNRRAEHWREVPIPPELERDLEMVHRLREASPRRGREPLWKLSRATVHRKGVAVMRLAGIEGPQACSKGLRHGFGIAAVLGHTDIATTAIYTTAVGVEARGVPAKMWR